MGAGLGHADVREIAVGNPCCKHCGKDILFNNGRWLHSGKTRRGGLDGARCDLRAEPNLDVPRGTEALIDA